MYRSNLIISSLCATALLFTVPAFADIAYIYNFGFPTAGAQTTGLPNPLSFTSNGVSVQATGFLSNNNIDTQGLAQKNFGNFYGLGLTGTPDNDINSPSDGGLANFVQINISNLNSLSLTSLGISVTSLGGNSWVLYGTDTPNTLAGAVTLVGPGATTAFPSIVDLSSFIGDNYTYLDVAATSGSVLLAQLDATGVAVPEPSTYMILGSCLLLAFFKLKRANPVQV